MRVRTNFLLQAIQLLILYGLWVQTLAVSRLVSLFWWELGNVDGIPGVLATLLELGRLETLSRHLL